MVLRFPHDDDAPPITEIRGLDECQKAPLFRNMNNPKFNRMKNEVFINAITFDLADLGIHTSANMTTYVSIRADIVT